MSTQLKPRVLPNERKLISKAKKGDPAAFSELAAFYGQRIEMMLFQKTQDIHRAKDIAQISWIKIWQKLKCFKGNSSFYTWCYRVAVNSFLDYRKRSSKYVFIEDLASRNDSESSFHPLDFLTKNCEEYQSPSPCEIFEEKESIEEKRVELLRLFKSLDGPMERVIKLALIEQLPYKEVAKIENVPIGTVMSRLYYARKKLQTIRRLKRL